MELFSPTQTSDESVNRIQQRLVLAFRALLAATLGELRIVTAAVGTGNTRVYHGLGRVTRGRLIVGQAADARVWDGTSSTAPREWVNLVASAPVTVKLIFF